MWTFHDAKVQSGNLAISVMAGYGWLCTENVLLLSVISYYLCTMKFEIRQYGRTELALLYSPNISKEAAWRKLKGWIVKYPGLNEELMALGYDGNQRCFNPKQVEVIVRDLGTH